MKNHETVDLGVTYFQSAHRGRLFLVLLRSAGASHHFSEEGIHWWTPTRGFLSHGGYHQIIQNLTILILKPFETYGFGEPPILRNLQLIKDLVIVRGNIH